MFDMGMSAGGGSRGLLRVQVANHRGGVGGTLKKCVNSQAVYPPCEQDGLEAHREEIHRP